MSNNRSWLSRLLFGDPPTAQVTSDDVKTAYEIIQTWRVNKPQYPQANFETNVRDGYRKNELIYACIALKADSAAQATLRVHRKTDGEELEDHPLRRLILNPSPRLKLTEFDFHAANFAYQDLAGLAHWEKVRGRDGYPRELLPLRADWMHPIPNAQNFLAGYEYRVSVASQQRSDDPIYLDDPRACVPWVEPDGSRRDDSGPRQRRRRGWQIHARRERCACGNDGEGRHRSSIWHRPGGGCGRCSGL